MGEWDRARRAYRSLIAEVDPAASAIHELGAVDLRPGGAPADLDGPRVLSGPDDLSELRTVVESVTGWGTWPTPALALVHAMGGLIDDRTGMWRTWKTTVELVAGALASVESLTIEAVVVES
jgi:hypothetical protein